MDSQFKELCITDPDKNGVCFVFIRDHQIAKVIPLEKDYLHKLLNDAPVDAVFVCEYVTGGFTFHTTMDEITEAVEKYLSKLVEDLIKGKEEAGDHAHYEIREPQAVPC